MLNKVSLVTTSALVISIFSSQALAQGTVGGPGSSNFWVWGPSNAPDISADNITAPNGQPNTAAGWVGYLSGTASPYNDLKINLSPTVNTTYATGGLTNGVGIGSGGNVISFCPILACVTSPSSDHQRTSALFWSTTADDGHSEEQTVAIETQISTGYAKPWAVNTPFSLGDNTSVGTNVYRATTGGTSASSGSGPSGTGSAISDGSVVWAWVNASAINAKVGLYNEVVVKPGAGNSWAQANNFQIQPGTVLPYAAQNTELDFTNNSGLDCTIGTNACFNLLVLTQGTNKSTAGINLSSGNTGSTYAAQWGLWINGAKLASAADIEDDSSGAYGLSFGNFLSSSHSLATISDNSTGAVSLSMTGTKTIEDIQDASNSPAAFGNSGTHSAGTFVDTAIARNPSSSVDRTPPKVSAMYQLPRLHYRSMAHTRWQPFTRGQQLRLSH